MPEEDRAGPLPAFLELAEALADTSRAIIRRHFRGLLDVEEKSDRSPVTEVDREAEETMRRLVRARFPEHGVVGEEHGALDPEAEYVWVFDPIDGTRRFIAGSAMFGTLIALLHRGEPIVGLVDSPIVEERWLGARGRPTSWREYRGEHEAHVRACPALAQAAMAVTSPDMFEGWEAEAFANCRARARTVLFGGDCLNYGGLASGFLDLVVESDLKPYDFLPLVPVIEGAGGVITDWDGRPLTLESGNRVLAAGDRRCHAEAVEALAPGRRT